MLKYHDIKVGDYLLADNDGDLIRGEVTNLNGDEKQVCVDTGVQEFWYETDQLSAIPLTEEELIDLKFTKEYQAEGGVKYLKGAFRMFLPTIGDFSRMEIWYRDERRHITHAMSVHELQNHFHNMTKVHLTDEVYA